ncbi:patatin-like phospholipase family protein [Bacillus vallismortis]|uniref:Patatin family protein n=1 Tax=Bacillus vallismortis TaxID=72361 RepID=A0AAP3CEZ5_BACVA|nr:patatin family protein [Bacillus vallismortis]MBG9767940.1 esterase [Bacillus vallismortis]MCI3984324.1 patatin family protein [Bacillus vallismortis]MCI4137333.1 patatin family protein [Bacillus vallismortis]MCY7891475.1 patatin family protein [Bacillus vallismortis]MCY8315371.1 patatin family protein [Bacillus vallismortis]
MAKPKIGLALGSGGARGLAHLGVLSSLHKHHIKVDMIAGSSMGALVGSFYAAGHDVATMKKVAKAFKRRLYADYTVPRLGFLKGDRVRQLVHAYTFGKPIEELQIPLGIVACDLQTGEKIVFRKGSVSDAVRASISIPGIFIPQKLDGRLLVDGAVVDRIPVSVVKDMGADVIIASDVSRVRKTETAGHIFDVIMQSMDILQNELVRHQTIAADIMIRPSLETYSSSSFANIEAMIAAGEEATNQMISNIRKEIENWEGS